MKVLVVPTIREDSIKGFIQAWDFSQWDKIIVIEDNPEKTFNLPIDFEHFSWKEIDEDLGEDAWIISRRDSAIRSYGFFKAYQAGAKYVFTLDDDCFATRFNHCNHHIKNLDEHPKWVESVPNYRTRGLPYRNKGTLENVVMSVGLWEGVPDLDSIQSIATAPIYDFKPLEYTRILARNQYVPICGMNLAFKREITPACYFPLMGTNSPFGRFDDIWCGVLVKKICDHLNFSISCGMPFIEHKRHSDPFVNLKKETPGIIFNEQFWEIIDSIQLSATTPKACMNEIAKSLQTIDNDYLKQLGKAIEIWEGLF